MDENMIQDIPQISAEENTILAAALSESGVFLADEKKSPRS
jgi:hypothetical protein